MPPLCPTILTVASLDWRNGHEFALQALALLKMRDIRFNYQMIGNGPFLEAVGFACHDLGLKDNVQFILQPDHKELEQYYARADVYLLAAVACGADNGLVKAVEYNLPIVCTDVLDFDNNLNTNLVYIAPRRNPVALANQVKIALSHISDNRVNVSSE